MTAARSTRARSATGASPCARTSSATGSRWPTSTSTSSPACSAAASCAAARARALPPRRLPRRPAVPLADAVRALVARAHRAARPTGRSGCSRTCARSATASTRSASTTASTPTASCDAVVAEVTNTPWGERHAYVLAARRGAAARRFDKALHVSPFMGMDQRYDVRAATAPARDAVGPHREPRARASARFDATLALQRAPLTPRRSRATARYPAATLRDARADLRPRARPEAQGRAACTPIPDPEAA